MDQGVCIGNAAGYGVIVVTPHQEEIGGGKYCHCDPDISQTPCDLRHLGGRHQRQLGHMTDRDTTAQPVFFGQVGDQVNVKIVCGCSDIEMHIDIDVEFSRERKNTAYLTVRVGVVPGRRAQHFCSAS